MTVDLSDLPIPPNCPYFSECDEGPGEKKSIHFTIEGGEAVVFKANTEVSRNNQFIMECLCHCDIKMVPVIAIIGKHYWTKEQDRIMDDIDSTKNCVGKLKQHFDAGACASKWNDAISRTK